MLGFATFAVNPFGPVHEYEVPPVAVRFNALPAHTGLLLEAVAVGRELTVSATAFEVTDPHVPVITTL